MTVAERGDRIPVPSSVTSKGTVGEGEDIEEPAVLDVPEDSGDAAIAHVSKTIEYLYTPAGRATFIADTDVDKLLKDAGATLTPEERYEFESELKRLDDQIEEVWFAEAIEQHRAVQNAILRGDVQEYEKGAAPYNQFLKQGAAVSFVPGAEKGRERIVVLTAANSPEWTRAREAHAALRQRRDEFIKSWLKDR